MSKTSLDRNIKIEKRYGKIAGNSSPSIKLYKDLKDFNKIAKIVSPKEISWLSVKK